MLDGDRLFVATEWVSVMSVWIFLVMGICAVQIAWTYLLSRAASDAEPIAAEEDERLVEAHPS